MCSCSYYHSPTNDSLNNFDPLKQDVKFRYNLLDRMKSDCEYYLGPGHRYAKHLWAKSPEAQIALMKKLYNSFDITERPEWISLDLITEYENRMLD